LFFALTHIKFEENFQKDSRQNELRILELKRLAEKVRSRFKVCAKATFDLSSQEPIGIAVTALGAEEEKLSKLLDSIVEFCEQSGFGRVQDELSWIDSIDILEEKSLFTL
jgi:uncharacterized protein YlxP (DUF503 family)